MRLGLRLRTPAQGARMLRLAPFAARLHPPPPSVSPPAVAHPYELGCNDVIGDCAWMAAINAEHAITARAGAEDVLPFWLGPTLYSAVSHFDAEDPGHTDIGESLPTVLSWWRHHGLGTSKIIAYAEIDSGDFVAHVKHAIAELGAAILAFDLPMGAQDQREAWRVTGAGEAWARGSWGPHATAAVAYDAYWLHIVTWGQLWRVTWDFFAAYAVEGYAVIAAECSPSGLDVAAMVADLRRINNAGSLVL